MVNYHPFEEAFIRLKNQRDLRRVKTFDELKEIFQGWAKNKAPLTRKQEKALAVEGETIGITSHVKQEKYFRDGRIQTRYRDVVTGSFVSTRQTKSNIPTWRKSETVYQSGVKINTVTKERIIIRDEKGRFLKKSEWKYYDSEGREKKLAS